MYSKSYLSNNGDMVRHGMLSHDQSANPDFFPLHTVNDDRTVIEGQSVINGDAYEDREETLLEQELDTDNILLSVFHQDNHLPRNVSPAAVTEDTITEKLQQQESRQAELNHYVKMLLQRSPADQPYKEKDHLPNGLRLIPSSSDVQDRYSNSSSEVISPIHSNGQFEQRHLMSSHHHSFKDSSSNSYQEVKHKAHPPQAAFTKTTVTPGTLSIPSQAREDVGITSQVPFHAPHTRIGQVAPHTPPRRERDSDDHPPLPGALTPHQVGQLSRMLGLFSEPGQPQITAEQLFAYLRRVQNNNPLGNSLTTSAASSPVSTKTHSTHEHHVPGHSVRNSPSQALPKQHMIANKARRSLDTNSHKRQGPSVSGLPINPPGSQVTKSAEQPGLTRAHKQPVRQVSSLVGPSLRNPAGVQDGTKSAAKVGLQSREPKAKSAAIKQTKISAWR